MEVPGWEQPGTSCHHLSDAGGAKSGPCSCSVPASTASLMTPNCHFPSRYTRRHSFSFLKFFFFFHLLNFKFHFTVSFCLVLFRLFVWFFFFQLFGHVDINSWTEFDWTVRVDFITWLNVNTNAEMLLPSFYFVSTAPLIEIWFVKLFHSNWVE